MSGEAVQTLNPYELSIDLGYSRKLSEKFSMGVVFRYIYSALGFNESYAGDQVTGVRIRRRHSGLLHHIPNHRP